MGKGFNSIRIESTIKPKASTVVALNKNIPLSQKTPSARIKSPEEVGLIPGLPRTRSPHSCPYRIIVFSPVTKIKKNSFIILTKGDKKDSLGLSILENYFL